MNLSVSSVLEFLAEVDKKFPSKLVQPVLTTGREPGKLCLKVAIGEREVLDVLLDAEEVLTAQTVEKIVVMVEDFRKSRPKIPAEPGT